MNTESSITDTLHFNFLKKNLIGGTESKIVLPTNNNFSVTSDDFIGNINSISQDNFSTTSPMEPMTYVSPTKSNNILKYIFYALVFYLIYSYYTKKSKKKLTSPSVSVSRKSVSPNVSLSPKSISVNTNSVSSKLSSKK